jgi:hypothetical protein
MMCAVGLVTEQQDFSTYKKPVLYEAQWWSQGLFIFTKSVTICTYFAAVSAAYTTCEKYVGISISSLSYGLQILFHKSLRLYCKRRLVIFQELLSPAHSEKNNRYPWFRASTADISTDIIFKMSAGKIVNASKGLFLIWYQNPRPLFDLEYLGK